MFFNTFLGAKLRRIISQIVVIFILLSISIYFIQNEKKTTNDNKVEVIYERDKFNEVLLENRKKISAPVLKIKVKTGDTLETILKTHNFNNIDIYEAIEETKKKFDPKNIFNGQIITIKYQIKNKKK